MDVPERSGQSVPNVLRKHVDEEFDRNDYGGNQRCMHEHAKNHLRAAVRFAAKRHKRGRSSPRSPCEPINRMG